MKNFAFVLLFISYAFMLKAQQNLTFDPAHPLPGDEIKILYNPAGTPLQNSENIDMLAFAIDNGEPSTQQLQLTRKGDTFTGKFITSSQTKSISLLFVDGDTKDNNNNKGYHSPMYDSTGIPLPEAQLSLLSFYNGVGGYVMSIEPDEEKTLKTMESALPNLDDTTKKKYLTDYIMLIRKIRPEQSQEMVQSMIAEIESRETLDEYDIKNLMYAYLSLKNRDKMDEYKKLLCTRFPENRISINESFYAIYKAKEITTKIALLDSLIEIYPDYKNKQGIFNHITHALIDKQAWDSIEHFFAARQMHLSNHEYNDAGWHMAEKGGDLKVAETYARKAVILAHELSPDKNKRYYETNQEYLKRKNFVLGHMYHTLGFVIMQQERYHEAIPELKRSVEYHQEKQAYINARLLEALFKAENYEEILSLGERLIAEGKSNNDLEKTYREAWARSGLHEDDLDSKMVMLHKRAKEIKKSELLQKMMMKAAPDFTLKNMKGEDVSLQSLKGKTLVVDFWATWCGPCIRSFPAMDQAIKNHKDDQDVAFLFINTREDGDDREKKITDLMEKKNLDWEVLLDEKDKIVEAYDVKGIPTKFVIDAEGNIRFKSVGYSGNKEKAVEELALMIEMSKEALMANR